MRKAGTEDKNLVVEILISAFESKHEGNSINLVVKQDDKRIQRMQILMAYLFEKAMRSGEVYISDNNKGCLLVSYSNREKASLKAILLDLQLALKCIGVGRIMSVLRRQNVVKKYFPKEIHIKPLILGAKKEYQGAAARFMIEIQNHFKDNKLPVVIDAAAEINVKLYEKFGFKVFAKDDSLGFPIYFLRIN